MIQLRNEQIDAMSNRAMTDYLIRTMDYLEETFPEACAELTREELVDVVFYGIETAAEYDLHTEPCLKVYLHLMFALGAHFDVDPRYPWAQEILMDGSLSPEEALEALCDCAEQAQAAGHVDNG